jgi:hypothetical protein
MVFVVLTGWCCHGATVWNGSTFNFVQSPTRGSDTILSGKVVLTRDSSQVLYNTAAGETFASTSSPADTEWAFGALTNFSTLTYKSMESMRNGNLKALILNKPMVMHIINEDIYLSVTFTAWGQHGVGGFAYVRSTSGAPILPTVSITSPSQGAVFAAPASVQLTASATVSGGKVTNVQYFAGSTLLGKAIVAPYTVTGSIPSPGSYNISAVATAFGNSATSSPVNITVLASTPLSLGAPAISNGLFSFSYDANPGLSYIVQSSSNLFNWTTLSTNVPSTSPVFFSDTLATTPPRYYRVGRLP